MKTGQFYPLWEELSHQDWPESTLYVVATPIGNLADITPRAIYALQHADIIACEDKRSSKALLNAWGINTALMAAHQHNEVQVAEQIIGKLTEGQRVALISDAGAPAISDPGGKIVWRVRQAGFEVRPIPGASAVIAALMASGLTNDETPSFTFAGFIPSKTVARKKYFKQWEGYPHPVVMFESPHRIISSIQDSIEVYGEGREMTFAREISKKFEQIVTLTASHLLQWLQDDPHRQKGEMVLLLSPHHQSVNDDEKWLEVDLYLNTMLKHISLKDAVKITTELAGVAKDRVYARALRMKEGKE